MSRPAGAVVAERARSPRSAAVAIRALVAWGGASFALGSLLHATVGVPLGFATLDEPRIGPAAAVEGLCALAFGVAAVGVFGRRGWGWAAAVGAHLVGLAGVALGTWAIAAGRGPESALNDAYHRLMLLLLPAGLVLLLTDGARAVLGATPCAKEEAR